MKKYETERLVLRTINEVDLPLLQDYLKRNRPFLSEWEPAREDAYYEEPALLKLIQNEISNNANETILSLYITLKGEDRIIGNVTLSGISRGVFQSCFMGYKLDALEINKGIITEAIGKVIDIAFNEYKLHRIEASIMPKNIRSKRVVEKLGFDYEGVSRKYLKINGVWEDHAHYVKLNPAVE